MSVYPGGEFWQPFNKIVVTGPQRSGTRIGARVIQADTGLEYIDETKLNIDRLTTLWNLMHSQRRFVVQCPALCRYVHMFSADDVLVVMMWRALEDIQASRARIGWKGNRVELARYDLHEGDSAEAKYVFWQAYQRQMVMHALDLEYESLSVHPLWVPSGARGDFHRHQTTRGKQ